jgi:hypothetical protein
MYIYICTVCSVCVCVLPLAARAQRSPRRPAGSSSPPRSSAEQLAHCTWQGSAVPVCMYTYIYMCACSLFTCTYVYIYICACVYVCTCAAPCMIAFISIGFAMLCAITALISLVAARVTSLVSTAPLQKHISQRPKPVPSSHSQPMCWVVEPVLCVCVCERECDDEAQ